VFGFLGPNGAGKTTSINLMCGLSKPDSGSVLIKGTPIKSAGKHMRTLIGMCPQDIILWERLTCLEQLVFVGKMYGLDPWKAKKRSILLLQKLGLENKEKAQARTLSGGMKRRLNLGMELVHDPEIIVLDEPEAGLDPQSRIQIREYIKFLAKSKTIILTTHNMDEADRLADRVAIIDYGKLLVLDTPRALKQQVGEGDVVEIYFSTNNENQILNDVKESLSSLNRQLQINISKTYLTIRTLDAVNLLPQILVTLKTKGFKIGEVRLRQNTLEDVFIQLTGRSLRE
jgi:ABC-2 type transport system ATP-binding protein